MTSPYAHELETLDRGSLRALQEERLVEMVVHAYEHQALTRSMWSEAGIKATDIASLDDFREKAPFISKEHIREFRERTNDPWGGLLAVPAPQARAVTASSGTTGRPTYMPGRFVVGDGPDTFLRVAWMVGARPGDYTVTWGMLGHTWPEVGITTVYVSHSPAERDLARLVGVLFEFRPTYLFYLSNPTIIALDDYATTNKIDLVDAFSSLRGGVRGGEPVGTRIKEIASRWKLELFDLTAGGDVDIAVECGTHTGNHIWEDTGFIECLDPLTREPVADGERGELVVTSLVNRIGPLIRSRTDDLVEFTQEPCGCGRTHARIRTIGRIGDATSVGGKLLMPIDVWPVLESIPETSAAFFQIVRPQREVDVLRLRVGYASGAQTGDLTDLASRVTDAAMKALDVRVEVELVENDVIMRSGPAAYKIPRVVEE